MSAEDPGHVMTSGGPDATSPVWFRPDARGVIVIGLQRCTACRHKGLASWPADCDAREVECPACGEMAASFVVAHRLEDFPDFDVRVRSRLAWFAHVDARKPRLES